MTHKKQLNPGRASGKLKLQSFVRFSTIMKCSFSAGDVGETTFVRSDTFVSFDELEDSSSLNCSSLISFFAAAGGLFAELLDGLLAA